MLSELITQLWPESDYTDRELALLEREAKSLPMSQVEPALEAIKVERKSRKVEVAVIVERLRGIRRKSSQVQVGPNWEAVGDAIRRDLERVWAQHPDWKPDWRTWDWAAGQLKHEGGLSVEQAERVAAQVCGVDENASRSEANRWLSAKLAETGWRS